jgi:hypothetical protein
VTPRFDDQDVAALYCTLRDAVAADGRSWWNRWRDLWAPEAGVRRREALAAEVYRKWQEARPHTVDPADIKPLNHGATNMALAMVQAQRRGQHYAQARQVEVRDRPPQPIATPQR